jgi:hypothetical protein
MLFFSLKSAASRAKKVIKYGAPSLAFLITFLNLAIDFW